jgi:hypothetical protein
MRRESSDGDAAGVQDDVTWAARVGVSIDDQSEQGRRAVACPNGLAPRRYDARDNYSVIGGRCLGKALCVSVDTECCFCPDRKVRGEQEERRDLDVRCGCGRMVMVMGGGSMYGAVLCCR